MNSQALMGQVISWKQFYSFINFGSCNIDNHTLDE